MFDTLIVRPIFNVLVIIYGLLPGHDFGIAIIIFSILSRMLLWPFIKKQLVQGKVMRKLQPEIKKIKSTSGGDKQVEAQKTMALYKKHGANPFAPIGLLIFQLPILIGLFSVIRRLGSDPTNLEKLSYSSVKEIDFISNVINNYDLFDQTLLGVVDLTRRGYENGQIYIPLILFAVFSGVFQYLTSKMLIPQNKGGKKLREILKEGADGKEADKEAVQAAVTKNTSLMLPVFTTVIGIFFQGAVTLYWATNSLLGYVQQRYILNKDDKEDDKKLVVKTKTIGDSKSGGSKKKKG